MFVKFKREFIGEFIGTFIMVVFGCGAVAVSILFDAYRGLPQTALIWGVGVSLAIYATRHLSCAHLNPAVTLAMVTGKRMIIKKMPCYISAQILGAFFAGLIIYILFQTFIVNYENIHGIVRGTPESIQVAKMFGEYYNMPDSNLVLSMPLAMCAEAFGTFLLVFLIFSLTEGCNLGRPDDALAPIFIGLAVSSIIALIAPLTQAGLNPARDFGPRLVTMIFGWGEAAFPDKFGGFISVYVIAPIMGGQVAGLFFTKIIEPLMNKDIDTCSCKEELNNK